MWGMIDDYIAKQTDDELILKWLRWAELEYDWEYKSGELGYNKKLLVEIRELIRRLEERK
nr:unnamed protein product [uncultured archaeal virus]